MPPCARSKVLFARVGVGGLARDLKTSKLVGIPAFKLYYISLVLLNNFVN